MLPFCGLFNLNLGGISLFSFFIPESLSLSFQQMRKEPEVVTVTLKKHNGMGLSIVAAKVGTTTLSVCLWFSLTVLVRVWCLKTMTLIIGKNKFFVFLQLRAHEACWTECFMSD